MTQSRKPSNYPHLVAKAKEFIERHWHENLSLEKIAGQVFVSPYHFQRVFKNETGETPKEYLTRIRLEFAVQKIRVDLHKSVYEVGLECGFSSQAVFARAFRQKFGVSATAFRNMSFSEVAKLAVWEESIQKLFHGHLFSKLGPAERNRFFESITFKRMEPLTVIYHPTTMVSEAHIGEEFQKLAHRAEAYDLSVDLSQCFGLLYDFPLHTPLEKCRYRVCLGIASDSPKHPKFSSMIIDGGKYGVFPLKGDIGLTVQLSILFYDEWLKASHFQRSQQYYFEKFSELPGPKTYTKLAREIFVPLKPA